MSGSQISPLTLAMLQAGGGGQNPTDPALAAALPRLQLAQGLMQQGTSDAPTTRIGILGRLGAALAGGYLANNANAGLQDILKQRQIDSMSALRDMRGDTPPPSTAAPVTTADASGTAPTSFGATYEPGKTNYYSMVRPGESGGSGDTSIKNPVSSAQGPVQATDATWNAFLASPQGAGYTMADRNKEAASQAFTQWNGDTNAATIQAMTGQSPTIGHVVAAHLVGGHGAASLLANPDQPITKLLTPGAIAGNSTILKPGMNGAQAMASIQNYYGHTANPDGATLVAGPGAPTDATPAAPQQSGGLPPQASAANALDMIRRANDAIARTAMDPYNPTNAAIAKAAAAQIEYAHTLLSTAQSQVRDAPGGGQIKATGERIYPPSQRPFADEQGNHYLPDPLGGPPRKVITNPTGIAGSGTENVLLRGMAELSPHMIDGTATPQQRATYNALATTYQHFTTATNPADQSLIRVPTTPLPPGMPQPGAEPSQAGAAAQQPPGGIPGTQQLTPGGRGPALAGEMEKGQAANDAKSISEEQAGVMKSHDMMGTTQTIRSMVPQVTTGTGANQRLAVSQVFSALGVPPETVKSWTGTDTPSGELLQKKLFELSTGATRAMGAREPGSVMMMFQKNYPNLDSRNMTIDAMTRLLDMDQLYKESEIGGRQQHLQGQIAGVSAGKPYGGMSGYQQPDPRVFQAAALASGGMPFSVWTQGLSPKDQQAALGLAEKVYPDATALNRDGVKVQLVRPQAVPNGR